jgi:hypothetical protein
MAFDPTLTWTDKFALFRTDGATTPLIRQEEVKPILMSQAEGSAAEYEEGIHKYKVETTRAAGYQDWTQGVLSTFT